MKKVGILTFHDADNMGAVLQCYALQEKLKQLGCKRIEVIDYKCEAVENTKKPKLTNNSFKQICRYVAMNIYYHIKKKGFDSFRRKYLQLSKNVCDKNNVKNAGEQYNTIVTGSDQVWNLGCSGYDYSYYLDFASENCKKVAYAVSLGNYKLSNSEYAKVKVYLNSFDMLSVREKSAIEEINREKLLNISIMPDPVFLLSNSEWMKLALQRPIKRKYIFVYLIQQDVNVMKYAKKYAQENNLDIISNKSSIKFIMHNSPDAFISWIANAEAIFTNSFHGTAFSLIFNKPLKADVELVGGGINNRIYELLNSVGAQHCIMKSSIPVSCPNASLEKIVNKSVLQFLSKILDN